MTDTELSAIRARAEAATQRPWGITNGSLYARGKVISFWDISKQSDLEFCAHARTDIPALLAHIEELKTALGNEEAESFALGIEIMLGEQRWTTEPPKEGGNYWWKCEQESSGEPQMVNVRITEGRFHFFFHYSEGPCLHTCEQCRWAGPIPMPKEPTS